MTSAPVPVDVKPDRPYGAVCAWCTPKDVLDALNQAYGDISHGMCATCEARLMAEFQPATIIRGDAER